MENIDVMEGIAAPTPAVGRSGDEALLVKFYMDTMQDKQASKEAGRPIFKDVEMVDIRAPGSRNNVVRVAREADKQRFPRHYAAFKNRVGSAEELDGTPLAEWPMITRSQAEEMAFLNVKTVEQLAAMADSAGAGMMGFYGLKAKAQEWLDKANGIEAMAEKLKEKDAQITDLMERLDKLEAAATKTPRKKKVTAKKE